MGVRPASKLSRRTTRAGGTRLLESLESRILLSAAPAAVVHKYRTDSFTGSAAVNYGATYVNPALTDAQQFFDLYHSQFGPYTPPAPNPTPDPNPDPTPTPDPVPDPTPDPAPDPAPTGNTDPVTITQSQLGNFTRLTITGTAGDDTITVAQSGDTLAITGNGTTTNVTGTFAEVAIYGGNGNDAITVQASVTDTSLVYGGAGNNTIVIQSTAKSFVVTLGGGSDKDSGNANTSFWADTNDTITGGNASNTHKVAGFYQPTVGSIPMTLGGQNLPDPTDSGATTRLTASLWGTGATMTDVNQGQIGDCYFLASLQSLAFKEPGMVEEMAVDLGDGTYAVEFDRGGMATYVRVDGDLPTAPWGGLYYAHPTSGGAIWAAIIEKAYAYFRTGASTYSSLNWGWTGSALNDLGVNSSTFSTGPASSFSQIATALSKSKAVAAVTNGTITSGDPIIGSHAYSVVAAFVSSGTQYVTLRNPWGFDGAGSDSNPNDGLVTITWSQFNGDFSAGSIQM